MNDQTTTAAPMSDEELAAIQQRTDAYGRTGPYGYVINDIEYQGNWVHDIHRLLDEVDRLRAETCSRRDLLVAEEIARGAQEALRRAEADRDALAAKVDAIQAQVESWNFTDDQIDTMASDENPVRRAEQWLKLTTMRACAESLKQVLSAAPEMP